MWLIVWGSDVHCAKFLSFIYSSFIYSNINANN